MTVTITKKPGNTVELEIELDAPAFQKHVDWAVRHVSEGLKIPGFRPGKAPTEVVKDKVGAKTVLDEAAEHAVRDSYVAAVREHELETVGPPQVQILMLAEGNPFRFRATAALLPKVKLGKLEDLHIKPKPVTVTDADVQAAIDKLRDMRRTETPSLGTAATGDKIEIDLDLFRDGVPIDGGASKSHPIIIGDRQFIPGFEEQLIGLRPGDSKEFTLTFPADYRVANLAGKPAQFRIKVVNIFHLKRPEADDAFAKSLGTFQTFNELQKQIRENIERERTELEAQRQEGDLLDQLIHASTLEELPALLLEEEKDKMLEEIEHDIEHRGLKMDDYLLSLKKTRDSLKAEFVKPAERRVKSALIIRAVAEAKAIDVSREEIEQERTLLKKRYADEPEAQGRLDDEDITRYLATVLTNRKVIALLRETATKKS